MLYVPIHREKFLPFLPKEMIAIEIGVQAGVFSRHLVNKIAPRELNLVDPWTHHSDKLYRNDAANKPQDVQDELQLKVATEFKVEIERGVIKLHRMTSIEAAKTFPDAYFDFAYIDAMHYHDAVLADLVAFAPKMKPDGVIAGHDFSEHALSKNMNFGVVSAASTFSKRYGFQPIVVTGGFREWFPSYFLSRNPHPDWLTFAMTGMILEKIPFLELPNSIFSNFHHINAKAGDNSDFYIPSFA